ncbi:glucosyltransferase domain-containing protein [Enterobacter roggenkampii]|jgi:hypothetical protein|uniref:glucosyltransferase domain-containing protein n=2 Tax=Enterobacter roggenkampii TaxID=1812935 RepID=UPI000A0EE4ED|nr:glucosyltransferase domain-containing protein [Enterobacter roggenkampii]EKY4019046.1 glucosyltransferase domain-containing protein [Enterobacter roggenkampii]MBT1815187.1 glucosyltransferase domain-containing protein [Enterobacter roggenkampii]MCK7368717.1 glucosyltransferase domain-containing protein [Enterobacter roggenkampii]MCL8152721.1 glucosyltransferase domain-containing protein [Enterobacter roggenkampii]MCM7560553.1 glucosyltransferase domain-containing protein [Enterobacter rogge
MKKIMNRISFRALGVVFSISILYCIGLIISGRNYLDDYGRYTHGYTSWSSNGRPFADLVMSIINLGNPIVDISPLPLIIALLCLSVMGVMVSRRFAKDANVMALSAISIMIITNPFLLENLSFKYDVLAMSLSMLVVSLPFVSIREGASATWRFIISSGCVFVSLGLYQSSIGTFIILTILECIYISATISRSTKTCIYNAATRALQLIVGYVFYNFLIVRTLINDEYTRSHSEIISFNGEGLNAALNNLLGYIVLLNKYVMSLPNIVVYFYFAVILLCSIFCFIFLIKKHHNFFGAALALISPAALIIFSFAHFLILKEPVLSSRVMTSFSATLISFAVLICLCVKNNKARTIAILPIFGCSIIFSMSYSNASKAQNVKDDQVAQSIYIATSEKLKNVRYVYFSGEIRFAEQRKLAISRFPVLADPLKSYFGKDQFWSSYMLTYNGVHVNSRVLSKKEIEDICSLPPQIVTTDYSIYSNGDTMIVSLNTKCL